METPENVLKTSDCIANRTRRRRYFQINSDEESSRSNDGSEKSVPESEDELFERRNVNCKFFSNIQIFWCTVDVEKIFKNSAFCYSKSKTRDEFYHRPYW